MYARSPKSVIDCMLDKKPYKLFIEQARLNAVEGIDIPSMLSNAIGEKFIVEAQMELFKLFKS